MLKFTLQTLTVASLLVAVTVARSEDKIETKDGREISGAIDKISASGIITAAGDKIPASDIDYVRFEREPPQLSGARGLMKKGDYTEALRQLSLLEPPTRLALTEEIAFRKAYCLVQLALPRDKDAKIVAYRAMKEFVDNHPNSFHYYEANRALGDILVAGGSGTAAIAFYDVLAKSPLDAYKMLGLLAKADLLYLNGKFKEAKEEYDVIMNMKAVGTAANEYALQGKLGSAACLAAMGESTKALAMTEEVIKNAELSAEQMLARAYNTLGKCYLNSKGDDATKQALRAFLIVDIVYGAYPEEHAESLYYLQSLWNKAGDRGSANEARARLQSQYPASSWAGRKALALE